MKRREFITVLGAAAAWPVAAGAQLPDRLRRVGMLIGYGENDSETRLRVAAFLRGLQELGWTEGRNVRIDYRYAGADDARTRAYATELLALAPDVLFAIANPAIIALLEKTRTVPIVFASAGDPIASGFVASLARPGGNITGFSNFESSMGGKWLELLKEVAPRVRRIGLVMHPVSPPNVEFLQVAEAAAPTFGVKLTGLGVLNAAEIERAVTAFAAELGLAIPESFLLRADEVIE